MNILVVGGGGREHALAWKLAQADHVHLVYMAPGNAGTTYESKLINTKIDVMDFKSLADFAEINNCSLTIIGPEVPLVGGIVDYFKERGLACFGPSKIAAQLEGSKTFAKDFLARHNIPTGTYANFTDTDKAIAYLHEQDTPIVVKADGLAAGKGVVIAETFEQAKETVVEMLSGNAFGEAGCRVVIEEFLEGEEASFIVVTDGEHIIPMATSQDHKRIGEGDTGPNTGGMGAYSPAPVVTSKVFDRVMKRIIEPTIHGMAYEGMPYTGFLYAGLMIDSEGNPKVIEFNCRLGDPETQSIMMRLKSNLDELCFAAIDKTINDVHVEWDPRPSMGVVLAASGYPEGYYNKGDHINGLNQPLEDGIKVFHAGTKQDGASIVTNGGRVLCVTALGENIINARNRAYTAAEHIHWPGCSMRRDIGWRAIKHYQSGK